MLEQKFSKNGGEFKTVKAGELFTVNNNPQLNKDSFTFSENGEYPYFTRTVLNNGIAGYVEYLNEDNKIKGNSLAVGMLGMQFFYMEKDFYAGQFTKTIYPKSSKITKFNRWIAQYFITHLNKFQKIYQGNLVRDFERVFSESELILPYLNNQIALDFIENFVSELQASRLRELQASRLRELQAYLKATGLADYELNDEEREIVARFDDLLSKMGGGKINGVEWAEFELGMLFGSIQQGERLTKSDQIAGNLPFVMSGVTDTGVVKYIGNSVTQFPKNSLTIDIFGNVFYRNFEFGASDDVGVYWNTTNAYTKETMLILAGSIGRALAGKFDYGYKLRSSRSHNLTCQLPIQNGKPDFDLMAKLGRAIEKLVIADVVKYADREMAAYEQVVR